MKFGNFEISEFLCGGIIFIIVLALIMVCTLEEKKIVTRYKECTCNQCQCNECGGK